MSITPSPSDNTTLTAVLASYAAAGFDGGFRVADDTIWCQSCEAACSPSELEISSLRRLEGASDPSDMSAVLALTCPSCEQRGTMVVMFGPEASAVEADLLQHAHDRRFSDEDELAGSAAPHEDRRDIDDRS